MPGRQMRLGVDGATIPDGLEERTELYRERVAGRRLLVVLDNAVDEAQVQPLVPGAPRCAVLVTCRSRLAGLPGAHLVEAKAPAPRPADVGRPARMWSWRRSTGSPGPRGCCRACSRAALAGRRSPSTAVPDRVKVLTPRDTCPDTGCPRLPVLWEGPRAAGHPHRTALGGPGTGWDPHELRHSAQTRLGEGGASLLMLLAKSRHKKPENVRRYFRPSPEAIVEVTSLLCPGDRRR
ncbi:hypothetical protein [Actinomadura rudentiformis]|uniref:hypothetical protein n=1 Tax=Actinomadura rudentiformis TaxID=359158 RepID=UPI001CEF8F86|nr:hypothetical protein [Actinomadura rudentiformis]